MLLKQQRHRTRDVRRRHRSAAGKHRLTSPARLRGMDVEPGRSNIRLEQMRLVNRPARTARRELVGQLCATDHDIAAKPQEQASRQLFLQFFTVAQRDHHRRDVHRAAGSAHRDRRPALVVHHEHRHRTGVLGALDLIEEKADTAIDHRNVPRNGIGVFQVLAGLRRIGVNHPASDLPGNLKFLRECRLQPPRKNRGSPAGL